MILTNIDPCSITLEKDLDELEELDKINKN